MDRVALLRPLRYLFGMNTYGHAEGSSNAGAINTQNHHTREYNIHMRPVLSAAVMLEGKQRESQVSNKLLGS